MPPPDEASAQSWRDGAGSISLPKNAKQNEKFFVHGFYSWFNSFILGQSG